MEKGIKQGDRLSPLLFAIFMDSILKHCKRRTPRMKIGNWNLRPVLIQALVYADDVLLIIDKKEYLQNAVIEWGTTFREREDL
jgi:retron-type reverse transcriptase